MAWAVARVSRGSTWRRAARRSRAAATAATREGRSGWAAAQPMTAASRSSSGGTSCPGSSGSPPSIGGRAGSGSRLVEASPGAPGVLAPRVAAAATAPRRSSSGVVVGVPAAAARTASRRGSSSSSVTPSARNGMPRSRASAAAGRSSRRVRARIAPVPPSAGHPSTASPAIRISAAGSRAVGAGARTSRPVAAGPGPDALGEALKVVLHEPDCGRHHGRWAAIVDLQVHAPEPGQRGRQPEDTSDVGEPPAIDRLVVVTDQEDAVLRRGQQERHPELARIDVLDLVDQEVRATRPPACEQRLVRCEVAKRERHEVVEIVRAGVRERGLVSEKRSRDRSGRRVASNLGRGDRQVQLQARERAVEPAPRGGVEIRAGAPEDRVPRAQCRILAGIAEDLEAERVEGAHAHGAGRHSERRERRVEPGSQLLRGPRVERDRGDRRGGGADGPDKPGDPRDQRGRLAATRRVPRTGSARGAPSLPRVDRAPGGPDVRRRMGAGRPCGSLAIAAALAVSGP